MTPITREYKRSQLYLINTPWVMHNSYGKNWICANRPYFNINKHFDELTQEQLNIICKYNNANFNVKKYQGRLSQGQKNLLKRYKNYTFHSRNLKIFVQEIH